MEGTLKCTLELREEENDPVGEFLCITGHYTSGLRATHPPLTKMRDQQNHFLPGSNGRNVECVFRTAGFRCSMSGNYSKATLWILAQNPFIMQWPEVIYGEMCSSAVKLDLHNVLYCAIKVSAYVLYLSSTVKVNADHWKSNNNKKISKQQQQKKDKPKRGKANKHIKYLSE